MASTSSSTRIEPLFDDGAAATASKDSFGGVEETLAKLAHQAATVTPVTSDPRPRGPASDKPTDARISQSSGAPTLGPETLGPADLRAQMPREPLAKRRQLARIAIAVCLCVAALWAWRSYGNAARAMVAALASPAGVTPDRAPNPAPTQAVAPAAVEPPPPPVQAASTAPPVNAPAAASVDRRQIDAMARDVAALRQTVEQLTAGQAQLKDEIAKLAAEKSAAEKPKKRVAHHVPGAAHYPDAFDPAQSPNAPGAPRTIGSVVMRGGAVPSTSAVSTLGPLPPPPPAAPQRPPVPLQQP